MDITIILQMIGGLVLFLYGIQYLGDSLKKVSSGRLEKILETLTSNKWKAALLGMLVTALIQSSGATIVMCVGFVNSGIMSLTQSVGVILGANIGTTITAWLLSLSGITSDNIILQLFKPANFSPILGFIGLVMFLAAKRERTKDIGSILLSFAILLIGMSSMSAAAAPLSNNEAFTSLLTAFSNPILGLLAGLIMTAILQSSSASIGILQALSTTGTVSMGAAIPIIMGENIGSALTGVISSIGASRNAKRAAWIQMFYCILKTFTFMIAFYSLNLLFHFPVMYQAANPVIIAIFHSIFNIAAVVIMLPISDILVKMVETVFPITEEETRARESMHTFDVLDERFLDSPVLALDQSKVVLMEMFRHSNEAMNDAMDLIFEYDEKKAKNVIRLEALVDQYEDRLDSYLTLLSTRTHTEHEANRLTMHVHSTNDLERISDHALNIASSITKMREEGQSFSDAAKEELKVFTDAVREILDLTMRTFDDNNLELARSVDPLEDTIDFLNMEIKDHHARRLQHNECTIEMGLVLSDITIDLERVADHCANMAVYMMATNDNNFVTHDFVQRAREAKDNNFEILVAGYMAKYKIPQSKFKTHMDREN